MPNENDLNNLNLEQQAQEQDKKAKNEPQEATNE